VTIRSGHPAGKILFTAMLVLLLAPAAEASKSSRVIGQATFLQGGKIATVQTNVSAPQTLSVKVTAVPAQKVIVTYTIGCAPGVSNGDVGFENTQPQTNYISAKAPLTRKLMLPFTHPRVCSVSVFSRLTNKGKQTLQVLLN
jgi:hypothetical protein